MSKVIEHRFPVLPRSSFYAVQFRVQVQLALMLSEHVLFPLSACQLLGGPSLHECYLASLVLCPLRHPAPHLALCGFTLCRALTASCRDRGTSRVDCNISPHPQGSSTPPPSLTSLIGLWNIGFRLIYALAFCGICNDCRGSIASRFRIQADVVRSIRILLPLPGLVRQCSL